jgi:hypothetical protein
LGIHTASQAQPSSFEKQREGGSPPRGGKHPQTATPGARGKQRGWAPFSVPKTQPGAKCGAQVHRVAPARNSQLPHSALHSALRGLSPQALVSAGLQHQNKITHKRPRPAASWARNRQGSRHSRLRSCDTKTRFSGPENSGSGRQEQPIWHSGGRSGRKTHIPLLVRWKGAVGLPVIDPPVGGSQGPLPDPHVGGPWPHFCTKLHPVCFVRILAPLIIF